MAQRPTGAVKGLFREYGLAISLAVLFALSVRFFVIEAYRIPSVAMRPTLEPGDTIFVAKWTFGLRLPGQDLPFTQGRSPYRGEVVVYSPPSDQNRDYVKRVIGLPGDTIKVAQGKVYLNGTNLNVGAQQKNTLCGKEKVDDHAYEVCWEPPLSDNYGPEKVPPGMIFVMGDLRSKTPDTKKQTSWGMIPMAAVKAKALWVWLSIEPKANSGSQSWFSRMRLERMFRRIQ